MGWREEVLLDQQFVKLPDNFKLSDAEQRIVNMASTAIGALLFTYSVFRELKTEVELYRDRRKVSQDAKSGQ